MDEDEDDEAPPMPLPLVVVLALLPVLLALAAQPGFPAGAMAAAAAAAGGASVSCELRRSSWRDRVQNEPRNTPTQAKGGGDEVGMNYCYFVCPPIIADRSNRHTRILPHVHIIHYANTKYLLFCMIIFRYATINSFPMLHIYLTYFPQKMPIFNDIS